MRAWDTVAGLVTRRPCGSVHTVTGEPTALPVRTRAWPVCTEPSGAVQRTLPHTRSPLTVRAFVSARPGARSVSRATAGRHSTRSRASLCSTDRSTARPADTATRTVNTQAPSTTQASITSA